MPMSRPVTGNVAKSHLWIKQKDGFYYCYERQRIWKDGKDITTKKLLGKADVISAVKLYVKDRKAFLCKKIHPLPNGFLNGKGWIEISKQIAGNESIYSVCIMLSFHSKAEICLLLPILISLQE